mgnify:CR=1 FL=1
MFQYDAAFRYAAQVADTDIPVGDLGKMTLYGAAYTRLAEVTERRGLPAEALFQKVRPPPPPPLLPYLVFRSLAFLPVPLCFGLARAVLSEHLNEFPVASRTFCCCGRLLRFSHVTQTCFAPSVWRTFILCTQRGCVRSQLRCPAFQVLGEQHSSACDPILDSVLQLHTRH